MLEALLLSLVKDCLFLLGYISSQQSFKKPLSMAKEREALAELAKGSEEARQLLIEHNMRLVVHIARKYKVPGSTLEDLISVGAVGLIKAVRSFDPNTGASLSTYAARCIENEVLMCLRQSRKQQSDVSLNEPLGTDSDGNTVSFMDLLGTDSDIVEKEVQRRITLQKVRSALPTLPKREQTVLSLRYGLIDGKVHPQHEIAQLLGISRSYVSRVEKHGIELLREKITQ